MLRHLTRLYFPDRLPIFFQRSRKDAKELWLEASVATRARGTKQRRDLRHHYSAPILEKFKTWLDRHLPATAPKTLLGKAIRYTLKFWTRLSQFLQDGRLALSNNATERAIKAVVIGRKNFLFANSPAGAHALANLYALVETAKANGLEPWIYLKRVFTALSLAATVAQVEALLPWKIDPGELFCG